MAEAFPLLPHYGEHERRQVPWAFVQPHAARAWTNYEHSLEELAALGGLGDDEVVALVENRPWRAMDRVEAEARLAELLEDFLKPSGEGATAGMAQAPDDPCQGMRATLSPATDRREPAEDGALRGYTTDAAERPGRIGLPGAVATESFGANGRRMRLRPDGYCSLPVNHEGPCDPPLVFSPAVTLQVGPHLANPSPPLLSRFWKRSDGRLLLLVPGGITPEDLRAQGFPDVATRLEQMAGEAARG